MIYPIIKKSLLWNYLWAISLANSYLLTAQIPLYIFSMRIKSGNKKHTNRIIYSSRSWLLAPLSFISSSFSLTFFHLVVGGNNKEIVVVKKLMKLYFFIPFSRKFLFRLICKWIETEKWHEAQVRKKTVEWISEWTKSENEKAVARDLNWLSLHFRGEYFYMCEGFSF